MASSINIVGLVGAVGVNVPMGAQYIYRVNFFAGFKVASIIYYLLCKFFPVPATSDRWFEASEQADRNFSAAYGGQRLEQQTSTASDRDMSGDVEKEAGLKERRMGNIDF